MHELGSRTTLDALRTWGAFGGPPIEPFDTRGWTTSVGFPTSAQERVLVQLHHDGEPLGRDLCPVPSTMPGPEDPVPPVFLVRITGQGGAGAFSSEALISYCNTVSF
ncbi:MAG: hypothetical protein AB7S26_13050 [Sandaracinaceae bacterium]